MRAGHFLPSGPLRVLERNATAYRRMWFIFVTGLFEPVLFLVSMAIGVGHLVGKLPAPDGRLVGYSQFVAPGLMGAAAMNGAILDTTYMFFIKLKYWGIFETVLTTPLNPSDVVLGEVAWAVARGAVYSTFFLGWMVVIGLVHSWLAVFDIPAAILVCWAFAGGGVGGSSYMRTYFDFDLVNLVIVPSLLFSGVFFPLSRYPTWLAWVVRCTPLYQGVALIRSLSFGDVGAIAIVHVAYLAVLGGGGLWIAARRIKAVLIV
jgi:lipooligosaccharide transport system permease protein